MMEPYEQECTVCRIVKNIKSPAYRRISDDGDQPIWFCLNCDIAGLECSKQVANTIKQIFGDDFGWDEFVKKWIDDLDPMKE